jgi:hypothetical protein
MVQSGGHVGPCGSSLRPGQATPKPGHAYQTVDMDTLGGAKVKSYLLPGSYCEATGAERAYTDLQQRSRRKEACRDFNCPTSLSSKG